MLTIKFCFAYYQMYFCLLSNIFYIIVVCLENNASFYII